MSDSMRFYCTYCHQPYDDLDTLKAHQKVEGESTDHTNPHSFQFKILYELRRIYAQLTEMAGRLR
jgi:hypothetical protein